MDLWIVFQNIFCSWYGLIHMLEIVISYEFKKISFSLDPDIFWNILVFNAFEGEWLRVQVGNVCLYQVN